MSQNKVKRILLAVPMLLFFALGILLYKGLQTDPSKLTSSLIGKTLPVFSSEPLLPLPNQKMVSSQDLLGMPALINVWATWCPTCKAEHKFLNELAKDGIIIYGINYHDQRDVAQRWLQEDGNPYVFSFYDPRGVIGIDLGVVGAPETYLVNAQGVVLDKLVGELNKRTWEVLRPQYMTALEQVK